MNQRIIAAFVSLVQHFDKLSSYKVSLRMKRYGHNKGGVTDFIPAETSQNIQLTCMSAKESCLKSFNAEMALLLHCRLIAMIPRPPRRVKLLQSHSHFMGQEGASWGRGTYQYLWWWCPDLQERHIRGVSQLRKWPLSEIKVTFWWQKWSVGQYRFPQTVYPIYVASKWGKLVYTKHKMIKDVQKWFQKGLSWNKSVQPVLDYTGGCCFLPSYLKFRPSLSQTIWYYHQEKLSKSRVKFMFWCV